MSDLPSTITHPEAFRRSIAPDFDGVFNWEWMRGIYPRKVMPMDFDGVVELNGWFFIFETKDPGKAVPEGQKYTFKRLPEMCIVFYIEGKELPKRMAVMHKGKWVSPGWYSGLDHCRAALIEWTQWIETNPFPGLDSVVPNKLKLTTITESASAYWKSKGWG